MDEGELAADVFGLRDERTSEARERNSRPISSAANLGPAADESEPCSECTGSRSCHKQCSAGNPGCEDSIRAPDTIIESRTDGDGRRSGRKCKRPLLHSTPVTVQPRGDQRRRSAARRIPLRGYPGNRHRAAGLQGKRAGNYFRDAPAEHARSERERNADRNSREGAGAGLIEPVDRASECERFAAKADTADKQ